MPAVSLGIVSAENSRRREAAAAAQRAAAAAPPPLTSEEARQQSQAEGLTLRVADSKTGYLGVHFRRLLTDDHPKPYRAQLKRSGVPVNLGYFATAVEAAMCVARTPERAAAAPTPLTSEEARQQAQAEGLMLLVADNNKAGYYGVRLTQPGHGKPYQARVIRGSKDEPGQLRHRRGGGAMRRSIARGAGGGGGAGCSGAAADERGGVAAGTGRDYQGGLGHHLRGCGGGGGRTVRGGGGRGDGRHRAGPLSVFQVYSV